MAQHFLLSAKARTLSIGQVMRMTDVQAETVFASIRWAETDGKAVARIAAAQTGYEARRPTGALRFRCKACRKDFSLTSGTLFAFHKMPLRTYLAAIVIFCNEVKGKSALALSRDLDVQYKTAFVLAHKLREAMSSEVRGHQLGGPGKVVEIDGGYFGGYVKPANHKAEPGGSPPCPQPERQAPVRGRHPRSATAMCCRPPSGRRARPCPSSATGWPRETEIMVDESTAWNDLARPLRGEDDQSPARLQRSWRLHERGGELLQPYAPGRDRATITISAACIWAAMPRRARGAKITAGRTTAPRCAAWSGWR